MSLRIEIDQLIASGHGQEAQAQLVELWNGEEGPSSASFLVSRYERLRKLLPLRPFRLALLRAFTVEPLVPLLRACCFTRGIDLTVQVGEFNTHAQEILDPKSTLYRFEPDAAVLAVQTCDVLPEVWRDFADLSAEERKAAALRAVKDFGDWVQAFRAHSQAHLIVHNLEQPETPSQGILDGQSVDGQSAIVRQVNQELQHMALQHRGVYVLDYDALVARYGRSGWHDDRKWLTVRMPIAAGHLVHMAREWLRFVHPLAGKVAKALVVDLDNTLWGGIIGEDGMAGIRLGSDHPGAAYLALQRVILDLYRRGILLAICSKNNLEDAFEVFRDHPAMLLRPQHFACTRINWNDKAQNLREIAAELNIGTDALAFLDDNPAERRRVQAALPEVMIVQLPPDPASYAGALRDAPIFERLTVLAEDQQRNTHYATQRERAELERSVNSPEDFLRALQQEAEIVPLSDSTLARIAQLTQKTNQFNLTTRRYTAQQLAQMKTHPDWSVVSIRVRDRYGDNGLVGVAILHRFEETCEIDTLLLSCRVIGRAVETALLSYLVERARCWGASQLQGWFLPTKRNAPAQDFYLSHRFSLKARSESGGLWVWDLSKPGPPCPKWIRLTVPETELQNAGRV